MNIKIYFKNIWQSLHFKKQFVLHVLNLLKKTYSEWHTNRKSYLSEAAPSVSCGLCGCCRWICGQAHNRCGCASLCSVCDEGWYHPLLPMSWSNWAPGRGGAVPEIGTASRPSLLTFTISHTLSNLKNSLKAHCTHTQRTKKEQNRGDETENKQQQFKCTLNFHFSGAIFL